MSSLPVLYKLISKDEVWLNVVGNEPSSGFALANTQSQACTFFMHMFGLKELSRNLGKRQEQNRSLRVSVQQILTYLSIG
jgi:hypothetical protein